MADGSSIFYTIAAAGSGAFLANFAAEIIKAWVRRSQSVELNRDDDLKEILKAIAEVQELSEKFWMSSNDELGKDCAIIRSRILARQQYVLGLIASLLSGDTKKNCDYEFTYVMNAVSGGDFMEPDRQAEPNRLIEIQQKCLKFCHTARVARRQLHRGIMA